MALVIFLALSLLLLLLLLLQGALGNITCENLPVDLCSFSISTSGKRCLLENFVIEDGSIAYQCKTSEVVVDVGLSEWIESDGCLRACGLDRKTVGISSDSFIQPHFMVNLCSHECYYSCPNIVDLYINLAIGEGENLSELCERQKKKFQVDMIGFKNNVDAPSSVSGPASAPRDDKSTNVPAPCVI